MKIKNFYTIIAFIASAINAPRVLVMDGYTPRHSPNFVPVMNRPSYAGALVIEKTEGQPVITIHPRPVDPSTRRPVEKPQGSDLVIKIESPELSDEMFIDALKKARCDIESWKDREGNLIKYIWSRRNGILSDILRTFPRNLPVTISLKVLADHPMSYRYILCHNSITDSYQWVVAKKQCRDQPWIEAIGEISTSLPPVTHLQEVRDDLNLYDLDIITLRDDPYFNPPDTSSGPQVRGHLFTDDLNKNVPHIP